MRRLGTGFIEDNRTCHRFRDKSYEIYWPLDIDLQLSPSLFFFGGGCDETPLMERYWDIKNGDIVIDAGSHIGTWTLPALSIGAEHVYCFDPDIHACQMLRANLYLNDFNEHVCVIMKGLSDLERMNLVPLDNYIFTKVDWIKIDVEGAELRVLKGAKNTIRKHNPSIIMEIHQPNNEVLALDYLPRDYHIKKMDRIHYLLSNSSIY